MLHKTFEWVATRIETQVNMILIHMKNGSDVVFPHQRSIRVLTGSSTTSTCKGGGETWRGCRLSQEFTVNRRLNQSRHIKKETSMWVGCGVMSSFQDSLQFSNHDSVHHISDKGNIYFHFGYHFLLQITSAVFRFEDMEKTERNCI